jgi:hypothetical protein
LLSYSVLFGIDAEQTFVLNEDNVSPKTNKTTKLCLINIEWMKWIILQKATKCSFVYNYYRSYRVEIQVLLKIDLFCYYAWYMLKLLFTSMSVMLYNQEMFQKLSIRNLNAWVIEFKAIESKTTDFRRWNDDFLQNIIYFWIVHEVNW